MHTCLVFPLANPFSSGSKGCSKFSYKHPMTLLSLFFLFFILIDAVCIGYTWIHNGGGINRGFYMSFQVLTAVLGIKLHIMARRWPDIVKRWLKKEEVFRAAPYQAPTEKFTILFTRLTLLTFLTAICDQILYVAWRYERTRINMDICHFPKNYSSVVRMYEQERPQTVLLVKINPWMSILIEIQYVIGAFNWTMSHNLTVELSIWLTARLQQLRKRIRQELQNKSSEHWGEIHAHFIKLADLVADVNSELGILVLMTLSFCLAFLCFFIFKLIRLVYLTCDFTQIG